MFAVETSACASNLEARSKSTLFGCKGVRAYGRTYAPGSPDVRKNWPRKIGLVLEGVRGRTGAYRLSGHTGHSLQY